MFPREPAPAGYGPSQGLVLGCTSAGLEGQTREMASVLKFWFHKISFLMGNFVLGKISQALGASSCSRGWSSMPVIATKMEFSLVIWRFSSHSSLGASVFLTIRDQIYSSLSSSAIFREPNSNFLRLLTAWSRQMWPPPRRWLPAEHLIAGACSLLLFSQAPSSTRQLLCSWRLLAAHLTFLSMTWYIFLL